MRLLWIRARAFVHATEDEPRVRDAILWLLGRLGDEQAAHIVERGRLTGHYGNEILVLEATLRASRDIEEAFRLAIESPAVKAAVIGGLGRSLDEDGVLHVRFDKQGAVSRERKTTDGGDAIVVRIKGSCFPGENLLGAWHQALVRPGQPLPRVSAVARPRH